MAQELWIDTTHGPDLWRMVTTAMEIVVPGEYCPHLPCLAPDTCFGSECDFCALMSDGMADFGVGMIIKTVPAFHEMVLEIPERFRNRKFQPGTLDPWTPLKVDAYHCGPFVAVEQHTDDPIEGEYGHLSVKADVEVIDDAIDGALYGMYPYWAIPAENIPTWLVNQIHLDQAYLEEVTNKTLESKDVTCLWDLEYLESVTHTRNLFDEVRYQWRAELREIGDECSSSQSR